MYGDIEDLPDFQQEAITEGEVYRSSRTPTGVTDDMIKHAAPALTFQLWRESAAVETEMHGESHSWSDADMLRKNTWATKLTWDALKDLAADDATGALAEDVIRARFTQLQDSLAELLPDKPKTLRDSYINGTGHKFGGMATALNEWGLEFWLHALGLISAQRDLWWASPRWPEAVDILLSLPNQPPTDTAQTDPQSDSLEHRLRECPWELDDEQAEWVRRSMREVRRELRAREDT